jgi:hypothetical protein
MKKIMIAAVQPDEADSMGHQHTDSRLEHEPGRVIGVPHKQKKVGLPNKGTQSPGF